MLTKLTARSLPIACRLQAEGRFKSETPSIRRAGCNQAAKHRTEGDADVDTRLQLAHAGGEPVARNDGRDQRGGRRNGAGENALQDNASHQSYESKRLADARPAKMDMKLGTGNGPPGLEQIEKIRPKQFLDITSPV